MLKDIESSSPGFLQETGIPLQGNHIREARPCQCELFGPADWDYQVTSDHVSSCRYLAHWYPFPAPQDTLSGQSYPVYPSGSYETPADSSFAQPSSGRLPFLGSPTLPTDDPSLQGNQPAVAHTEPSWSGIGLMTRKKAPAQKVHAFQRERYHSTFTNRAQTQPILGPWNQCDEKFDPRRGGPQVNGTHPVDVYCPAGREDLSTNTRITTPFSTDDRFSHNKGDLGRPNIFSRRGSNDSGCADMGSPTSASLVQQVEPLRYGDGRWYCSKCGEGHKIFKDYSNCVRHIKGAHGLRGNRRRVYLCVECEKTCSRWDNLRSHMMRKHGYTRKTCRELKRSSPILAP